MSKSIFMQITRECLQVNSPPEHLALRAPTIYKKSQRATKKSGWNFASYKKDIRKQQRQAGCLSDCLSVCVCVFPTSTIGANYPPLFLGKCGVRGESGPTLLSIPRTRYIWPVCAPQRKIESALAVQSNWMVVLNVLHPLCESALDACYHPAYMADSLIQQGYCHRRE